MEKKRRLCFIVRVESFGREGLLFPVGLAYKYCFGCGELYFYKFLGDYFNDAMTSCKYPICISHFS